MSYTDFLTSKTPSLPLHGRTPDPVHPSLFGYQKMVTEWAIRRGRAAEFLDTGLGKTRCQVEWARQSREDGRALIVAPIAVAEQTIAEAAKMGVEVVKVADPSDAPMQITNYEKLHRFVGAEYRALVLDEASILKSMDGKTRNMLLRDFTHIPRRLCCTATPAPNDILEIGNYAEFLGVMPLSEIKATFFVHDSERTAAAGWRIKGHAEDAFWRWVAKWAVYVRRPSDLGFDDEAFRLPELRIHEERVVSGWKPDGMLFATGLGGIDNRREVRRETIDARIARASSIIKDSREQWLVWVGLNDEGDGLEKALGDECVQISGADDEDAKIEKESRWRSGAARVLITKSKIFGFGLNWQHCHRMMFLGLGDSYEAYYQSIRRCWRFGQKHPVDVVIVVSDAEMDVANNVRRKEVEAARLAEGVVAHAREAMNNELRGSDAPRAEYNPTVTMSVPCWLTGSAT